MKSSRLERARERSRMIELRARRVVDEQLSGRARSLFRGRGIDFDEVREYVAGDDVRAIDWNITARAGKPFVKRFREERELTVILAVDLSASGDFGSGTQNKREVMAEVACILALAALRQRDKVGLLMFSDHVERFVPPSAGRGHVLRLVNEILMAEPRGRGTDLVGALDFLNQRVRRRAAVVLLSDLIVSQDADQAPLSEVLTATAQRHELLVLWAQDPREHQLPNVGPLTLEDAETGEVVVLDTSRRKVRETFEQIARQQHERRRNRLRGVGARVLELQTGADYVPRLVGFLSGRARASGSAS